jgi:hypothetical protein
MVCTAPQSPCSDVLHNSPKPLGALAHTDRIRTSLVKLPGTTASYVFSLRLRSSSIRINPMVTGPGIRSSYLHTVDVFSKRTTETML